MDSKVIGRFWKKVDRRGPEECWAWTGVKTRSGYGRIVVRGKAIRAHRLSLAISVGDIPAGLFVCHRCDNPPCVNPAHLFLGTGVENVRDRMAKGRGAQGSTHAHAKLNPDKVVEIRQLRRSGISLRKIADRFGVRPQTVHQILRGKRWVHVGPPAEQVRCVHKRVTYRPLGTDGGPPVDRWACTECGVGFEPVSCPLRTDAVTVRMGVGDAK